MGIVDVTSSCSKNFMPRLSAREDWEKQNILGVPSERTVTLQNMINVITRIHKETR